MTGELEAGGEVTVQPQSVPMTRFIGEEAN